MKVKTIKGSEINLVPGVQLDGEMLRDLDLRGVDLTRSVLIKCFFNESLLNDSSLRNCNLSGGVFYRTDLSGADLSGAILNDCYWNEVRYSKATKWPSGFQAPERRDPLEDVIRRQEALSELLQYHMAPEPYRAYVNYWNAYTLQEGTDNEKDKDTGVDD
jgi:hypothetical protein